MMKKSIVNSIAIALLAITVALTNTPQNVIAFGRYQQETLSIVNARNALSDTESAVQSNTVEVTLFGPHMYVRTVPRPEDGW